MGSSTPFSPGIQELADEHRHWHSPFHSQHLANWEKLLASDDEAALTEAAIRRLLQYHWVCVEPSEKLTGTARGGDAFSDAGGDADLISAALQ